MKAGGTLLTFMSIGLGGFLGAISRYILSGWAHSALGARFPFGTFLVNVLGSVLLGFVYTLSIDRGGFSPELRMAITVGFLGSLTTFSTFSLETFNLINDGSIYLSALNIMINVTFSIMAVILGVELARFFEG